MNNNYLHYKKNNLNLLYLGVSILLIGFGIYKNGYLVYKELHNKVMLFKPLLFPVIGILISGIISIIKNRKIELTDNMTCILILSLCIPVNTSLIIYSLSVVLFSVFLEFLVPIIKIRINYAALFKLLIVLVLIILNKYTYLNNLESINKYSYNLMDIFLGRGISGVCTSSMLFILIGYAIFMTNIYYKKEIPLISISCYLLLAVVFKFIFGGVIVFNSLLLFTLVFMAPLSMYSPAGFKERIVYSVLVGGLTFIFTYYLSMYEGAVISVLISSILNYINIK